MTGLFLCFEKFTALQLLAISLVSGGRSNSWRCGEVDMLEVVAVAAPPPAVESGHVVQVEVLVLSQVRC